MNLRVTLTAIDRCLSVAVSSANLDCCRQAISEGELEWLTLISLANKHLVAPALWTTLSRPELRQQVPEDVQDYLALLHMRNVSRNERIRQQCLEIGSILMKNGLSAVLLKGTTWLFDGSFVSDRMMQDIDLLVPHDSLELAVDALVASGYGDTGESLSEAGHFHHAPLLPPGGEAIVEIHRDLSHRADLLPTHEAVASASEVAPGLLLPTVRHRIMHNVIHAQIENGDLVGGILNLRDALDLARLVARCGTNFDWISMAEEARNRGLFRHLSSAVHLAHRVLGSPLPPPLTSLAGKFHAWRCVYQREWPAASKLLETTGSLARALAWDRDAYPLNLEARRSWREHILVNRRRAQRAKAALSRLRFRRSRDPDVPV